jgi:hypothetical protein
MPENKMLEASLAYAARGWRVFPVAAGKKTPRTANGFLDGTVDQTEIRVWWEGKPFLNIGVAMGAVSGIWSLDVDGEPGAASVMDLEQAHGELPDTLTFRTPRGGRQHLFAVPAGVKIPSSIGILPGIDVRGDGGYSVVPPSIRPEGAYTFTTDSPIADAPAWLIELVTSRQPARAPTATDELTVEATAFRDHPGATAGTVHREMVRLIGCEIARGAAPARIVADAFEWGRRCRPPADPAKMARAIADFMGKAADTDENTDVGPAGDGDDYDPELEAIPLRARPWPARPQAMLEHGVVGDLLRRVELETEADPVAIATTFLTALGNVIGRGPYAVVDGTRHGLNLFVSIVGGTSEGRKGTSMGIVRRIMRDVDADWVRWCRTPNLVSGEGLIDRVRDDVYRMMVDKKTGQPENVLVEPGVEDKRLLCEIQELAGTMRAGRSERSTLFQTMREAWDGVDLATMSKNSRRTATEPHVSIVSHVTPEELAKLQTDADVYGGSWNRFLWIASKRARLRPHGGDFEDLGDLQDRVRSVVTHARNVGKMRRTPAADRLWETEYYRRAEIRAGGVVGAILGRAEPQLLRLSMLAALARESDVVDVEDLAAALALWQYADETVRMLFSGCEDPLVSRLIEAIRSDPGISRSALHRATAKTMPSAKFVATLEQAAATGAVESERVETAGRPREIWRHRGARGEKAKRAESPVADGGETFSPKTPLSPEKPALPATLPGRPAPSSKHGRTL